MGETTLIPSGWRVECNGSPDRALNPECRYMVSAYPQGVYLDALGGRFGQDPGHSIPAVEAIAQKYGCKWHLGGQWHAVTDVPAAMVYTIAERLAEALRETTGLPVEVVGAAKRS